MRTLYSPDIHVPAAKRMAEAGALDYEIAKAFQISHSTFCGWQNRHPEFREALKRSRNVADDMVQAALFRSAVGASLETQKAFVVSDGKDVGSHVEVVGVVEQNAPNVAAAIFWLKNRRPEEWRDTRQTELSGVGGGAIKIEAAKEQRAAALEAFRDAYGVYVTEGPEDGSGEPDGGTGGT